MTKTVRQSLLLLFAIVLLGLLVIVARTTMADIRFSAANYYYENSSTQKDDRQKQDSLNQSFELMEQAVALDPMNSGYHLQTALVAYDLEKLQESADQQNRFYTNGKNHLYQGLRYSPTRSDLWAQLAKILYEKEGASESTLAALDEALNYGPRERGSFIVNAMVTLYFWEQLEPERQQKSWLILLDSLNDYRMEAEIRKHARLTGWERQLDRALKDRNSQ